MEELERLKRHCEALKAAPMLQKAAAAEQALDSALHCIGVLVARLDGMQDAVMRLRIDQAKQAPL